MSFEETTQPQTLLRTSGLTYPQQPQFPSRLNRLSAVIYNNDPQNGAFYAFSQIAGEVEFPIPPNSAAVFNSIPADSDNPRRRPTFAIFVRGTIAAQDIRGYEIVG